MSNVIGLLNQVIEMLTPKEVKPSLESITKEGLAKMAEAVEKVIAKHEEDIKEVENQRKAEKESAMMSIAAFGTCAQSDHQRRLQAAMNGGHQRYLDQLVMADNSARGVCYPNPTHMQGAGAAQLSGLYGEGWL